MGLRFNGLKEVLYSPPVNVKIHISYLVSRISYFVNRISKIVLHFPNTFLTAFSYNNA